MSQCHFPSLYFCNRNPATGSWQTAEPTSEGGLTSAL